MPDRLRSFVIVALHTGMRRGELQSLRWADVDFATGTIHIKRDKAGNGLWVILSTVALLAVKREPRF